MCSCVCASCLVCERGSGSGKQNASWEKRKRKRGKGWRKEGEESRIKKSLVCGGNGWTRLPPTLPHPPSPSPIDLHDTERLLLSSSSLCNCGSDDQSSCMWHHTAIRPPVRPLPFLLMSLLLLLLLLIVPLRFPDVSSSLFSFFIFIEIKTNIQCYRLQIKGAEKIERSWSSRRRPQSPFFLLFNSRFPIRYLLRLIVLAAACIVVSCISCWLIRHVMHSAIFSGVLAIHFLCLSFSFSTVDAFNLILFFIAISLFVLVSVSFPLLQWRWIFLVRLAKDRWFISLWFGRVCFTSSSSACSFFPLPFPLCSVSCWIDFHLVLVSVSYSHSSFTFPPSSYLIGRSI